MTTTRSLLLTSYLLLCVLAPLFQLKGKVFPFIVPSFPNIVYEDWSLQLCMVRRYSLRSSAGITNYSMTILRSLPCFGSSGPDFIFVLTDTTRIGSIPKRVKDSWIVICLVNALVRYCWSSCLLRLESIVSSCLRRASVGFAYWPSSSCRHFGRLQTANPIRCISFVNIVLG